MIDCNKINYLKFVQNEKFTRLEQLVYCGFGLYHHKIFISKEAAGIDKNHKRSSQISLLFFSIQGFLGTWIIFFTVFIHTAELLYEKHSIFQSIFVKKNLFTLKSHTILH